MQTVILLLSPPLANEIERSDDNLPYIPVIAPKANTPKNSRTAELLKTLRTLPLQNQKTVKRNRLALPLRLRKKVSRIYMPSLKGAPPYQPMTARRYA